MSAWPWGSLGEVAGGLGSEGFTEEEAWLAALSPSRPQCPSVNGCVSAWAPRGTCRMEALIILNCLLAAELLLSWPQFTHLWDWTG